RLRTNGPASNVQRAISPSSGGTSGNGSIIGFSGFVGECRMTIRRTGGLAHEQTTEQIIGAFFEVYNALGYGLLESVYKAALLLELKLRGVEVACEVGIQVYYKGVEIAWQLADLVV